MKNSEVIITRLWEPIKGYEDKYLVSNDACVYSLKSKKQLKPYINSLGYLAVDLCDSGKRETRTLHRLVAEAFIPNPENKPEVNHLDGNKAKCQASNLEWSTRSENLLHAYRTGLRTPTYKAVSLFEKDGEYICSFKSMKEAEEETGISRFCISKCCSGVSKTAGGYVWKYAHQSYERSEAS